MRRGVCSRGVCWQWSCSCSWSRKDVWRTTRLHGRSKAGSRQFFPPAPGFRRMRLIGIVLGAAAGSASQVSPQRGVGKLHNNKELRVSAFDLFPPSPRALSVRVAGAQRKRVMSSYERRHNLGENRPGEIGQAGGGITRANAGAGRPFWLALSSSRCGSPLIPAKGTRHRVSAGASMPITAPRHQKRKAMSIYCNRRMHVACALHSTVSMSRVCYRPHSLRMLIMRTGVVRIPGMQFTEALCEDVGSMYPGHRRHIILWLWSDQPGSVVD